MTNPVDRVLNVLYAPDAEVVSPDLFLGLALAVNAKITLDEANRLIDAADMEREGFIERLRANWDDEGRRISLVAPRLTP